MADNAILDTRLVGDIEGEFLIPEYQRGYRWCKEQVDMLLNDIWENGDADYCLQPIVVKKLQENRYELIDGQQRLTTLFLVTKYLKQLLPFVNLKFSLQYQIRERSKEFLDKLDESVAKDNVDFFHIYNAYQAITDWFADGKTDKTLKAINLYKNLGERVKFIWYEVDSNANGTELFIRLNIGKIPLTNAELVKALFLARDTDGLTEEQQLEIATTWNAIEQELHNPDFWAFLTNEPAKNYSTRIELLFNMLANKGERKVDSFYTFFYFADRMKAESKKDIWKKVQEFYLILREWFEKRDVYHKVGYLVTTGIELQQIIRECVIMSKSKFDEYLNEKITCTLKLSKDQIHELNYQSDKAKIEKVLLLFNVESTRLLQNSTERYSFSTHKQKQWSLEHIHAQNSEGLNKKEDQQNWLSLHKKSLQDLTQSGSKKEELKALIQKIDNHYENVTKIMFDSIFAEVFTVLSKNDDRSYMDSISNMALLSQTDNAVLNNSTFDVKRNKILEMDRRGEYIPICTRRVFLKYYSESNNSQLHFWGTEDRKAYIEAMVGQQGILIKYLTQPLQTQS